MSLADGEFDGVLVGFAGLVFDDAVGAEGLEFVIKLLVVCGDHSAFSGGDVLHWVKGENGEVGKRPVAAFLFGSIAVLKMTTGGVAGVFDNPAVVFVGKLAKSFEIDGTARKING